MGAIANMLAKCAEEIESELADLEVVFKDLKTDNAKLRDMLEIILMKLEDYHKYAKPERNAFIENMPIHIRATLNEKT